MKKHCFVFLLLMVCCFSYGFAQKKAINIKGSVSDTTTGEHLTNATVCLLQAKDSILEQFVRVDPSGLFSINNIDTGNYVLLITYPKYADYVQKITVLPNSNGIELGKIKLIQTEHLLQDVIVSQQVNAIRIKGDTTEYAADSFKVKPNANVEDLLKALPGIQVDKDGKITAQGQTVQKVLVDGEEFFGDDPTLVTKNLRADMIDKVQVFDKSSDQATFTGIDDPDKQKTINLKIKANKKNGYFGKIDAGYGTDKYYSSQDMFNYFKNKRKLSAYGTFGNTGRIGLGFQDQQKYGEGNNISFDGGGVNISYNSDSDPLSSFDGNYNGRGLPDVKTGGVHYDNKWDSDKQNINLNYKIGGMSVKGDQSSASQNNLPGGVTYNNSNSHFNKDLFRQKANGTYEVQLDSLASLKFSADGSLSHSNSDNYTSTDSKRGMDSLINDGTRRLTNVTDVKAFSGNILWRQKFKKKGRTLSLNLNTYLNDQTGSGYNHSNTNFYSNNTIDSTSKVDQFKKRDSKANSLDAKLTYTEPLTKLWALVANIGANVNNSKSNVKAYNKGPDSTYSVLDNIYSNDYSYDQTAKTGGLALSYNTQKVNLNFGSDLSAVHYDQTNNMTNQVLTRNFVNWNPNASIRYKISMQRGINFRYRGSTQQPSIRQIQPVLDNDDPLNTYTGNPDLNPSFNNNFSVGFNDFKILGQRYIYGYASYNFTTRPIVTNDFYDINTGKHHYSYLNISTPNTNFYSGLNYGRKWIKMDIFYNFGLNLSGNKYVSMTNDTLSITHSNNYGIDARISKEKDKKYSFSLSANLGYNANHSNLQTSYDNNSWNYSINPDIDIYLPAKFQIHTDANYIWQQTTTAFTKQYNPIIWNAWVGKHFLKKENLLLKLSVNDILDQNVGFNRNVNNYTISQSSYTTIRRYFLLSVVWDFSRMGGEVKK